MDTVFVSDARIVTGPPSGASTDTSASWVAVLHHHDRGRVEAEQLVQHPVLVIEHVRVGERARQPELLQRVRTESARDVADLLGAVARGLAR